MNGHVQVLFSKIERALREHRVKDSAGLVEAGILVIGRIMVEISSIRFFICFNLCLEVGVRHSVVG